MMNRNVKIGVNSHASRLIGSAPGWAGSAGLRGRGDRVARGVEPPPPGAQAATRIAMAAISRTGPIQDRWGRSVTRWGAR